MDHWQVRHYEGHNLDFLEQEYSTVVHSVRSFDSSYEEVRGNPRDYADDAKVPWFAMAKQSYQAMEMFAAVPSGKEPEAEA